LTEKRSEQPDLTTGKGTPKGATLSWRILPRLWREDAHFEPLLSFFRRFPRAIDEIAFFDGDSQVPGSPPLEQVRANVPILRSRMAAFHAAGVPSAGVNVLVTLGHGGADATPLPFAPAVGHDGRASAGSACWNDPALRSYTAEHYRLIAQSGPDFIWVDDDLRAVAHGVRYPCFCPTCLDAFGHGHDRERLVAELNEASNLDLRLDWTEFCAASLESLLVLIREAIKGVDAGIEIGLMTIGHSQSTYAGYPIRRWAQALGASRVRPGHGYYTDAAPRGLIGKAMDVGRQVRECPRAVRDIQYEMETWPFVNLDKSVQTVLNEVTAAMAVGCTGAALDELGGHEERYAEREPLAAALVRERAVWDAWLVTAAGLPLVGFWPADHTELMARRGLDSRGWFCEGEPYNIQEPNELIEMGIPLTTAPEHACGMVLSGRTAEAFTDEELHTMLGGAVLMDIQALAVVWQRGLGELTGVRQGRTLRLGLEQFTDHPINASYAGATRWARAHAGGVTLERARSGVAALTRLVGQSDHADQGIGLSVFENEIGGRVAVSGYFPWHHLGLEAKRHQLVALADWLCRGRLPVVIEQTVRLATWVRCSADGKRTAVALLNTSFDDIPSVDVRLRAKPDRVRLLTVEGPVSLAPRRTGDETVVTVPELRGWRSAILVGGPP
jgi:hypothetical protein